MDKRIIIAAAVVLLAASGVTAYFVFRPDSRPDTQQTSNRQNADPKKPPVDNKKGLTGGSYIGYEDGIIAKTEGTKILFFYAPGSTQFQTLDAAIKAQGVPAGVTIFKVDYAANQTLRQQYGVTQQTTFVKVYDNGQTAKTFIANDDPTLGTVLGNLL